jgi:hypothetical protein
MSSRLSDLVDARGLSGRGENQLRGAALAVVHSILFGVVTIGLLIAAVLLR